MNEFMEYYDQRAAEYDSTVDQAAAADARRLATLSKLPPCRTLDVACGTGAFTRVLRGEVVGFDQSPNMLAQARKQAPNATFDRGDAFRLPFVDDAFDRVVATHFYGHLDRTACERFAAEARRVGGEFVLVEARVRAATADGYAPRTLTDGRRFSIYTRYFEPSDLEHEIDGECIFDGEWFVAVQAA